MKKKFGIIVLLIVMMLSGCSEKEQNGELTQLTQNNLMEEKIDPDFGFTNSYLPQ